MEEKNQSSFAPQAGATTDKPQSGRVRGILTLEVICLVTWLVGILFFYLPLPKSSITLARISGEQNIFDIFSIMISVIGALLLFYWLRRKRALGQAVSFLLGIMIYNVLAIFIEPLVALTMAVLFVYLERTYRSFVTNNFLLIIGIFAAGISFTNYYKISFLFLLLGLFSLYDIFGVFWIKTISKVAKSAAQNGLPLVLLAPKKGASWWQSPSQETTAAIIGAGDLFIPLVFLTSVSVQFGWAVALCSLGGAIVGNLGNFFLAKKIKTGIPAIPLLAIGLVAGYWLGRLIV